MPEYVVYRTADGVAVSFGTVLPAQIPAGLTVYTCAAGEYAGLLNGTKRWNTSPPSVVPVVPTVQETNLATLWNRAETFKSLNLTYIQRPVGEKTQLVVRDEVDLLAKAMQNVVIVLQAQIQGLQAALDDITGTA